MDDYRIGKRFHAVGYCIVYSWTKILLDRFFFFEEQQFGINPQAAKFVPFTIDTFEKSIDGYLIKKEILCYMNILLYAILHINNFESKLCRSFF